MSNMSLHRGEGAAVASPALRLKGLHTEHLQELQSTYWSAERLYRQGKYREGEQLVWEVVQQQGKTLKTEDAEDLQYWRREYRQLEQTLRDTPKELQEKYVLARLQDELSRLIATSSVTPVRTPSPLPREHMQPTPSAEITPSLGNYQQEYVRLFAERPKGLSKKSAWLRQLRKQRGKEWYNDFFNWYTANLRPPGVEGVRIDISSEIDNASRLESWHPANSPLQKITRYLSNAGISTTPDLYLGRYNDHSIGVVLNGSALDPPAVSMEMFTLLGVQYAHLPIFVGLRFKESKDDLCLLILGNVYASSKTASSDNDCWFDTRFVLALDTARHQQNEFLLVYKYQVYSINYLDDGNEERSKESEHKEPPRFCNGSDAFTVALLKTEMKIIDLKDKGCLLYDIKLSVRSITEPDVAVAGFVDEEHPYIPVFPSRDK